MADEENPIEEIQEEENNIEQQEETASEEEIKLEKNESDLPIENISKQVIEDEMKSSFLNYAMSVIVSRALPDVRDGLKPVHRRILFAMNELGMVHNKPFKKSARIVGEVLGKYHPHGDTAVYDTMVRMAQSFSLRYPLIDGQGNFGSIDGDNAAAMRYCVTGDTLISTDKGIIPIKEISNKKEAKINIKILSYNGKKNKASKFFNSGKHKTIKILTKSGYSLEGSYNHPILTWKIGENFKPIISWKVLEELKKDDVVIINRNHNLFSKQSLNLIKYYPKTGFKNEIKLPSKMNDDLAFLLGALVSEGSFHNKQILFNNKDMVFYEKVKSIILSQFKGIQLYERKIKGKCKELSIYEQKIVKFLNNIDFKTSKSHEKYIPFSILQSTKTNIKHFLTGLFEGDGSIIVVKDKRHNGKSMQLTYDSKSKYLIEQLKILLSNFGIISQHPYTDKRNNCLKLYISGYNNIFKFYQKINFFSKRKKDRLKYIKRLNPTRLSKTDFIPFLNDYLRLNYTCSFIKKNNFDRYNSLIKNYSRLLKIINKEDKNIIDWILNNNFYFDQLIEIERIEKKKDVYSIKVNSDCHSFIANGFINHNTEARLKKIAEQLLVDIDKDTIDFRPNFDGSLKEPIVLPSKLPNLLINGSSGIAVGMATNIPPHNVGEIIDGTIALIENPEIEIEGLMEHVKGPDFPTGGKICGRMGILGAYNYGRGKIIVRAKIEQIEEGNRQKLIVKEIPYMVNKTNLINQIADCVRNKRITGISDLRDESDREGMRIVVELKKDSNPQIVENQLYKMTSMQTTFGVILLALDKNVPRVMNLKQVLEKYVEHRQEVVRRRTNFELNKAQKRAHILEGLIVALDNIDEAIKLIKASKSAEVALGLLTSRFELSKEQSQAILDMKLQRLTNLEQNKIKEEHANLMNIIAELTAILADEQKVLSIIKEELLELKEKYEDERRTEFIAGDESILDIEDLIKEEKMVVTATHAGYIKRTPLNIYKQQKRGGKGIIATGTKEEDFVEHLFVASTHSYVLFFTDKGQVHWLKVYRMPEASRQAKGKAVVNLLDIAANAKVTALVKVKDFDDKHNLIMATKKGIVKKVNLSAFSKPRKGGIRAITLDEDDYLINVELTDGEREIIVGTKNGMAIKFKEKNVRTIGRTGRGVRGIRLKQDDEVVGMEIATNKKTLLTITKNGYGKQTPSTDYRLIGRGGTGVINIKTTDRNGEVVAIKSVYPDNDIMFISQQGIIIRTPVSGISTIGRNTQGVRLMRLSSDDYVVAAAKIINEDRDPSDTDVEKENGEREQENELAEETIEEKEELGDIELKDELEEETKELDDEVPSDMQ